MTRRFLGEATLTMNRLDHEKAVSRLIQSVATKNRTPKINNGNKAEGVPSLCGQFDLSALVHGQSGMTSQV